MSKLLYLFTLVFILSLWSCKRVQKIDYYKNGQKKSELHYHGDKLDGLSKYFYDNGQLQSLFNYHNGILEGQSISYFFDGNTESIHHYQKGKLNGISKLFYPNGAIKEVKYYHNDSLDGKYIMYYKEKSIRIEGKYNMAQFDSIWNYYDKYGRLVGQGKFTNGNGNLYSFYPNGKIKINVLYRNSQPTGTEIHYNSKGIATDTLTY